MSAPAETAEAPGAAPVAVAPRGIRRWGGYIALVVVFTVACAGLSWWQWARRAETLDAINLVQNNWDSTPVAVTSLIPTLDGWDAADEWRPVALHGSYLAQDALLVRNRPRDENPGFEQLVPLLLDDGTVFVVDRGWLPVGNAQDAPDHVPAPPTGEVSVVARIREGEPTIFGRTAPAGQIATIHLPDVATLVGKPTYTDTYGLMASETPASADPAPAAAEEPPPDEGPHLSYALQWILFGILAVGGLVWAYRREKRIQALPVAEQFEARKPKRRTKDSDDEDAILDGLE